MVHGGYLVSMPFSKVPYCAHTRVVLVPRDFCSSQAGMKYDRNSHFEVEPGHEFRWICATFLTGWGYALAATVLQNPPNSAIWESRPVYLNG